MAASLGVNAVQRREVKSVLVIELVRELQFNG
jgi:hypothetical protein